MPDKEPITSIVYATIRCVVQHKPEQDPEDILAEANYEIAIEPDETHPQSGRETPKILATEMTETENRGECHPTEHYLLEERRRDEKHGLYAQHDDPAN